MAGARKQTAADEDPGAPEWMVTFSDCMTLLLTFFVLLLSFSSFDDKVFSKMESAFSEGLASLGVRASKEYDALTTMPRFVYNEEPIEGSTKPTVDGQYESNPSEKLDFLDFQNQKVFLVPSDKIFLGMGIRMSPHGRQMLADVGALLKSVPNRVVVSEHAVEDAGGSDTIGLKRAWEATQFIAGSVNLDKTRFSISSAGTMAEGRLRDSGLFAANPRTSRVLEIVILERSTYR
jgi:hypothetical protein